MFHWILYGLEAVLYWDLPVCWGSWKGIGQGLDKEFLDDVEGVWGRGISSAGAEGVRYDESV